MRVGVCNLGTGKSVKYANRCRHCGDQTKDNTYIISSGLKKSSLYNIPMTQEVAARTLYNEIRGKDILGDEEIKPII